MFSRFPHLIASLVMTAVVVTIGSALVHTAEPVATQAKQEQTTQGNTSPQVLLGEETDPALVKLPKLPTSSSTAKLIQPPLSYLLRVKGDPKALADERAVRVPVLMYHQIRPLTKDLTAAERRYTVRPEIFEAQLHGLLEAGFTPISPDFLLEALTKSNVKLPEKPIILTFDDGFRSHYQVVFPLLKKYNIPATFFVLSDGFEHIYLNQSMLKEMAASPLVTIASHTKRHAFLAHVSSARRHDEIFGSKEELETIIGKPIKYFAYPYGDWNQTVVSEVKQAGYELAFGVRLGSLQTESTRFQLRRIQVQDSWDVAPICEAFLKE